MMAAVTRRLFAVPTILHWPAGNAVAMMATSGRRLLANRRPRVPSTRPLEKKEGGRRCSRAFHRPANGTALLFLFSLEKVRCSRGADFSVVADGSDGRGAADGLLSSVLTAWPRLMTSTALSTTFTTSLLKVLMVTATAAAAARFRLLLLPPIPRGSVSPSAAAATAEPGRY